MGNILHYILQNIDILQTFMENIFHKENLTITISIIYCIFDF